MIGKKEKRKNKKKSLKKLGRSIADVGQIEKQIGKKTLIHSEQIDMSDSQRLIAEQMTEVERTDVQQIDSVDGRQIEKQIDSEIENVLLDNLGKDLAAQNQTENR